MFVSYVPIGNVIPFHGYPTYWYNDVLMVSESLWLVPGTFDEEMKK